MASPFIDSTPKPKHRAEEDEEDDNNDKDNDRDGITPLKYVPLCDVYSATSPFVGARGSKKVKASRSNNNADDHRKQPVTEPKPTITQVYTRKRKRKRQETSFFDSNSVNGEEVVKSKGKQRRNSQVSVQLKTENEVEDESAVNKSKVKLRNSKENLNLNLSNGCKVVVNNKEKQKMKLKDSAKVSNGCRENEDDNKGVVVKCKDKQKPKLKKSEVVSLSKGKGKEKEVVVKNGKKRKVANSELVLNACTKSEREDEEEYEGVLPVKKKREGVNFELANLGIDADVISQLSKSCLRETRNSGSKSKTDTGRSNNGCKDSSVRGTNIKKTKENCASENNSNGKTSGSIRTKKWVWLSYEGVDPEKFIGLQCKVFWPLDADWYSGCVTGYNPETGRHHVKYKDGDEEHLILSNERIKFLVSLENMNSLKLRSINTSPETDGIDVDEMVVLAATFDDCGALEPGEILWAKLTGHAMWPAIVLDESLAGEHKGLNKVSGEKSVLVQFFGTHDFARVKVKQVVSFLKGLFSSFHLKCKKPKFVQGLEEAKRYLSEQKLSKKMLRLQNRINADNNTESEEDEGSTDSEDEGLRRKLEDVKSCPFDLGDLQIVSLGTIVEDSALFQDEKFIWPEGYTAVRKFPSATDPGVLVSYKMEVLRDPDFETRPLFRVTSDGGEQFKGSTPSACWNRVYKRMRKTQVDNFDESICGSESERAFGSGSHMFGFSHPEILKLIKKLSKSSLLAKSMKLESSKHQDLPAGYRPVRVKWKDLDKCNVCHMDEEYENNLFLQCDKCRIMVHARCYGERVPMDGALWLCNLCRPGAPAVSPPCCLCPVTGGAMKPTTDGRWAHLACAIWIPETCLSDIKKMQPIDGLSRISKDRWKLLCSICGVPYGACIQCSNHTCRVAYHPLCARAAGFCVELEDEDRLHLIPMDEDEEGQCIRLLSFCKKHRAVSNERPAVDDWAAQKACECSDYVPPPNPSGCARSEPYNYFGRRGRKEPELLTAASLKRSYVENRPYLVGGHSQHEQSKNTVSSSFAGFKYTSDLQKLKCSPIDASRGILSVVEKYDYMKKTFRKRLAFGKSGIHGFGIFAKLPHKAGDMVIEYTGELVRPPVADRREHQIYNSLIGAGTYMFRIDDEHVIDATRAGSIAHLINHSCEPNCYSRGISVNGNQHIIIFAKRDIKQWEELTYDYRFFSIDEQLACYCGFPRCRGVVNDTEAEERMSKLYVRPDDLIDWGGE